MVGVVLYENKLLLGEANMCKSKDEYLMLREEILQLETSENSIMGFFYAFIASIIAFSLGKKDTMYILISYIAILPVYRLVLSKEINIYRIGSYLHVFHEGKEFNWERRSSILCDKLPEFFKRKIPTFNYPFIFISTFILIIFLLRTDWEQISSLGYEFTKVLISFGLYIWLIYLILKNRKLGKMCFIPSWEEIQEVEGNNTYEIKH